MDGNEKMKKIIAAILFTISVFLTVQLAHKWLVLDREQQAFIQLAVYVADNKKYVGNGNIDTADTKTVDDSDRTEKKEVEILQEYQELVLKNPDFAGWIIIDDTAINYPIMQTPGELEYYLYRDFTGQDSYAGTPFVGGGNLQEKGDIFVYGHNMKNGTMFADLLQYQKKTFWDAHPVLQLDNLYEHREYRVFSVFYAEETEWHEDGGLISGGGFGGSMTRDNYIEILKKRGLHEYNVSVNSEASLLFLVTCSYWKEDGRLVVVAVREK